MKALFAERGHLNVNTLDYGQGTLFYKVLATTLPFPSPLLLLRSDPYWLGCPFLTGSWPLCEGWSMATPFLVGHIGFMVYLFSAKFFVKSLREF